MRGSCPISTVAAFALAFLLVSHPASSVAAKDGLPKYPFHDITTAKIAGEFRRGEINRFLFSDWKGPQLPVWMYVPAKADLSNSPILFMMHGTKRDSHRYMREWRPLAEEHGIVVVSPEFTASDFPESAGYNLGNVFRVEGRDLQDEAIWSFSAIEPIFDFVVAELGSQRTKYAMFGHSAGSQFVHRYLYYKPNARIQQIIAANAGWYTVPDLREGYPYGLKGAEVSEAALKAALQKDVVVLLGDRDKNPNHRSLRRTPEAMRQGPHRFARGIHFHQVAVEQAEALAVDCGWKLIVVPGVAHSNGQMAAGSVHLIE